MRKIFALIAAAILLAGCALAQGTMLSDNTARITARANSTANRDRVIQDALAEAARLTRAKGYRYFIIRKRATTAAWPTSPFSDRSRETKPT